MQDDEIQRLRKLEVGINALLIAIALLTLIKLICLRARATTYNATPPRSSPHPLESSR